MKEAGLKGLGMERDPKTTNARKSFSPLRLKEKGEKSFLVSRALEHEPQDGNEVMKMQNLDSDEYCIPPP